MAMSVTASPAKKPAQGKDKGTQGPTKGPKTTPGGDGYDAQQDALKPGGHGLKSQLLRVQITASKLHVRSSPDVKQDNHLGYVKRDDVVAVQAEAGDGWLKIEFNGADAAFISGKWAKPAGGAPGVGVAGGAADANKNKDEGTAKTEKPATDAPKADADTKADKAPAKTPDKKAEDAVPAKGGKANRMEVTSSTLNVRSSPVVKKDNKLGQLTNGAVVEVLGVTDGWASIKYESADKAFVSAKYLAKPQPKQSAKSIAAANDKYGAIVSQLAADFQSVPVWNPKQAATEKPAGHFKTPYVLNVGKAVSGLSKQYSAHKALSAREGGTVSSHTGNRPFIGKGTPKEVQIVAQAAIDAGKTTVSGIQAYINNGPLNDNGNRKNGRWGVDCSGLTVIAVNEMAGKGRSIKGNISAKSYRPGGSAVKSGGFRQITGDNAQAGDVISYMSTNHVLVIHSRVDTKIKDKAGKGETKPAIMLKMAESTASKKAGHRGPQTARVMWYVPGAKSYIGKSARTSPDVTLANRQDSGKNHPTWMKGKSGLAVVGAGFSKGNFSIVRPKNNKVLEGKLDESEKKTSQPKK